MRIGYLGGSFDPVHVGHLALAEACREGARLDRVVLTVAGTPPHKLDRALAPAAHRVAMARLAAGSNPSLDVDDRETRRGGPSFTVETVRALLAEREGDRLHWLIGADSLPELASWREIEALLDLVTVVTAYRPGHEPDRALRALEPRLGAERVRRLAANVLPMPLFGVSSTEIRERVREGRSIRYLVPDEVRAYIGEHGLYAG